MYEFLAYTTPEKIDVKVHKNHLAKPHDAGIIAQNAWPGSICERALKIFASCYGSQCGTMALSVQPFGGSHGGAPWWQHGAVVEIGRCNREPSMPASSLGVVDTPRVRCDGRWETRCSRSRGGETGWAYSLRAREDAQRAPGPAKLVGDGRRLASHCRLDQLRPSGSRPLPMCTKPSSGLEPRRAEPPVSAHLCVACHG